MSYEAYQDIINKARMQGFILGVVFMLIMFILFAPR